MKRVSFRYIHASLGPFFFLRNQPVVKLLFGKLCRIQRIDLSLMTYWVVCPRVAFRLTYGEGNILLQETCGNGSEQKGYLKAKRLATKCIACTCLQKKVHKMLLPTVVSTHKRFQSPNIPNILHPVI